METKRALGRPSDVMVMERPSATISSSAEKCALASRTVTEGSPATSAHSRNNNKRWEKLCFGAPPRNRRPPRHERAFPQHGCFSGARFRVDRRFFLFHSLL